MIDICSSGAHERSSARRTAPRARYPGGRRGRLEPRIFLRLRHFYHVVRVEPVHEGARRWPDRGRVRGRRARKLRHPGPRRRRQLGREGVVGVQVRRSRMRWLPQPRLLRFWEHAAHHDDGQLVFFVLWLEVIENKQITDILDRARYTCTWKICAWTMGSWPYLPCFDRETLSKFGLLSKHQLLICPLWFRNPSRHFKDLHV